ncbi:putative amidohydrolase YtcJ [Novosphingobium chloroacetimidivorans]|uniref:Putative amidohydrolase YtcJ n=1 Tax=Novosphingobium chloroacetimidivorans TaxID=1428314 RepID=A0A7W7KD77_9SPHN|nr:amidohydrolase family protein [Novosphingobium chloroacetimidivorans]MBB4860139.1 putative amidohydrolase YtcJ [Novosphingobium chloroacetimidivorans]
MLIREGEVRGHGRCDVRIARGRIAAIGRLAPEGREPVIDASGGALLPGLHDHHLHLAALAARDASIACGPPEVRDASGLAGALQSAPGEGWIRGIGYHESVLGHLADALELDSFVAARPLRIQHRSGRMWLLNSLALEQLLAVAEAPPGLERAGGGYTGRLFDADSWLQTALASAPPALDRVSTQLARYGVTGVTEISPRNDPMMAAHFAFERGRGSLRQRCLLAGALSLADAPPDGWSMGPAKLHLHEAAMPDFDAAVAFVRDAHRQHRPVAVHCVSEVELVFALAAIDEARPLPGDRIEHVSVATLGLLDRMAELGLHACVQPSFVHERGDRYLADVEARHQADLYRLRALVDRGIPLAGGSDAPYGSADPWVAMQAAVSRRTASGAPLGLEEALTPDEALALFLADPLDFTGRRRLAVGAPADLVLLDRPWREARQRLTSADVAATFIDGELVHDRIDQSPGERLARTDPAT